MDLSWVRLLGQGSSGQGQLLLFLYMLTLKEAVEATGTSWRHRLSKHW